MVATCTKKARNGDGIAWERFLPSGWLSASPGADFLGLKRAQENRICVWEAHQQRSIREVIDELRLPEAKEHDWLDMATVATAGESLLDGYPILQRDWLPLTVHDWVNTQTGGTAISTGSLPDPAVTPTAMLGDISDQGADKSITCCIGSASINQSIWIECKGIGPPLARRCNISGARYFMYCLYLSMFCQVTFKYLNSIGSVEL